MNPYISDREDHEYGAMCHGVEGFASRYEGGDIGYHMFGVCQALLTVMDFEIAVNSFLQKGGEKVEFVLME